MSAGGRFWTLEVRALVVVALIIAILGFLKSQVSTEGDVEELKPSTFLSGRSGLRALYLAAEELKIPVGRWMLPLFGPGSSSLSALAIVSPADSLLPSEVERLRSWVREGGRLLYVPSPDRDEKLLRSLGFTLKRLAQSPIEPPLPPPVKAKGDQDSASRRIPKPGEEHSELALRLLAGTPDSVPGFPWKLERQSGDTEGEVLLADQEGFCAAVLLSPGRGRILVLSHALPITNGRIRSSGAAPLALRALAELSDGERIWFDEFHHGFDERGGIERAVLGFLTRTPGGWAVIQAACLGIAAVFFAGLRMGSPLRPGPVRRRSSLEHVGALAAAYHSAAAHGRAAALLLEGLRLRLGVRSPRELDERLNTLERTHPPLGEAVEEVRRFQARRSQDLVRLTRAIDRVLSSLGEAPAGGRSRHHSKREGSVAGKP